jgi:hypothetical protein
VCPTAVGLPLPGIEPGPSDIRPAVAQMVKQSSTSGTHAIGLHTEPDQSCYCKEHRSALRSIVSPAYSTPVCGTPVRTAFVCFPAVNGMRLASPFGHDAMKLS